MDLILRDESFIKIRPLNNAVFKCSFGVVSSDNDFSLQIPYDKNSDAIIWRYVSYGNTEFGGKILERVIDTAKATVMLYGVTFRGTMGNTIATPEKDVILKGRDFEIIKILFEGTTLNYEVEENANAIEKEVLIPKGYSLLRAVEKVLREFDEKFSLSIKENKIHLSISKTEMLDSRLDANKVSMVLDDNKMLPNCFFAVGMVNGVPVSGTLYADNENKLTDNRYFTGDKAVEAWKQYDTDFETYEDFRSNMVDDFYNLRNKGSKTDVSVELTKGGINDRVKVSDAALGVSVVQTITERHINHTDRYTEFTYSTGG